MVKGRAPVCLRRYNFSHRGMGECTDEALAYAVQPSKCSFEVRLTGLSRQLGHPSGRFLQIVAVPKRQGQWIANEAAIAGRARADRRQKYRSPIPDVCFGVLSAQHQTNLRG